MKNRTIGSATNAPLDRRIGRLDRRNSPRPGLFGSPGRVLSLILVGAAALTESGCDGTCEMPTERVAITLPDHLEHECENGHRVGNIVGAVSHVDGHLAVTYDDKIHEFPDLYDNIPDGTLVWVSVNCNDGRILLVQNLSYYDQQANPTEYGWRFWALLATGAHTVFPSELTMDYALEEACKEPDQYGGHRHAEAIIAIDGSSSVVIDPGETGEIEIHEGAYAGRWSLENVNIVYSDDDYALNVDFRLFREN